ncbi:MAG: phage tail assembly chaperone [Ramlibacter sp.]
MTGKMPEEGINPVALPPVCEHVWRWFLALNRERPPTLSGAAYLTSEHILSWCALEGIRLAPWELLGIRECDAVAVAFARKNS